MMVQKPDQSLPKQCGNWADLKAGYRLLSSDEIDPQAIGQPHRQLTCQACAEHALVLCVQDDTHLAERCDRMQHTTLAVLPDGRLLGMLDQRFFARAKTPEGETRVEREARWRESSVWCEAAEAVGGAPAGCRFVHIADRAADDLNVMEACERRGAGFVIRARHDRRINGGQRLLWEHMQSRPVIDSVPVQIGAQRNPRGRITREPRQATLALRVDGVHLQSPQHHPGHHEPRPVWAISLREEHAPAGTEPVDWMLLTSEPVTTPHAAQQVVGWYQRRWVIEEWHRALKEGCRAEMSQLDDPQDHLRLAAILSVIAVRLLQLRDMADPQQRQADDPAALQQWASRTWIMIVSRLAKTHPTMMTPRLFLLTVAKRGGYLGRARDPRPGWKVLWRGWYDISLLVEGAELASAIHSPTRSG